jgi:chorismate mutase
MGNDPSPDDAPPLACRGIRGAITSEGDDAEAVEAAATELLDRLVDANGLALEDLAAVIFTLPEDLAGSNPAARARAHGWSAVPLLVVKEHGGDITVPRCLRVLVLWNTTRPQRDIRHVYLRGAAALRPDLEDTPVPERAP